MSNNDLTNMNFINQQNRCSCRCSNPCPPNPCCCPCGWIIGPQGPTGATGPQGPTGATGPANGLVAYGGLYNNLDTSVTLIAQVFKQITFNNVMPSFNTTVGGNTITIMEAGDYEINWTVIAGSSVGLVLTVLAMENGNPIPSTASTRTLLINLDTFFGGSVILSLNAGDVIDLAFYSTLSAFLNLGSSCNATLSVKKLNA